MKTEKIKPEQTEKRKKENAVAKSKKDRNAKIPTPCPECHKVFQSYNSMTSHKTRAHSKNTATYKNAHKEKSLLTITTFKKNQKKKPGKIEKTKKENITAKN